MVSIKELYNSYSDIDVLENDLKKFHIYVKKQDDGVILFESNLKDTSIPYDPIRSQLKGVVFDSIDEKILALPSTPIRYFRDMKIDDLTEKYNNSEYKIYNAEDGTTLTLYKFDGVLSLASANSTDLSEFKWKGDRSIADLFFEVALQYDNFIKKTGLRKVNETRLTWDLPSNISITLGFHHHDMHPSSITNKVWFIDYKDNDTELSITDTKIDEIKSWDIHCHTSMISNVPLKSLIDKCNLESYIHQVNNFYGYILEGSDKIFIPSSYYKELEAIFYIHLKHGDMKDVDRYKHNILRSLLKTNMESFDLLRNLSIEYKSFITQCTELLNIMLLYLKLHISSVSIPESFQPLISKIYREILINEPDLVRGTDSEARNKALNQFIFKEKYTRELLALM